MLIENNKIISYVLRLNKHLIFFTYISLLKPQNNSEWVLFPILHGWLYFAKDFLKELSRFEIITISSGPNMCSESSPWNRAAVLDTRLKFIFIGNLAQVHLTSSYLNCRPPYLEFLLLWINTVTENMLQRKEFIWFIL